MTPLKSLTLDTLVDAAYLAAIDGTPVFILIAAPSGSGKTWCTRALSEVPFVHYIGTVSSPNEHREIISRQASRTKLLINDDLGLASRWNAKEFFATFCMIADGELRFRFFMHDQHKVMRCSMVLCCTPEYYAQNSENMKGIGLFDRVIPVVLDLSARTRKKYQQYTAKTSLMDSAPEPRTPILRGVKQPKTELVKNADINPRMFRNLLRISQYLTEEETRELIEVAHKEGEYAI